MKSSATTLAERGTTSQASPGPGLGRPVPGRNAAAALKTSPPAGAKTEPALFVASVDGYANPSTAGSCRGVRSPMARRSAAVCRSLGQLRCNRVEVDSEFHRSTRCRLCRAGTGGGHEGHLPLAARGADERGDREAERPDRPDRRGLHGEPIDQLSSRRDAEPGPSSAPRCPGGRPRVRRRPAALPGAGPAPAPDHRTGSRAHHADRRRDRDRALRGGVPAGAGDPGRRRRPATAAPPASPAHRPWSSRGSARWSGSRSGASSPTPCGQPSERPRSRCRGRTCWRWDSGYRSSRP